MALDNFELGIRSVTYITGPDGKPVEMDSVDWTIQDYHHNLQNEVEEFEEEPANAPSMVRAKRKCKPKATPVADASPKMVGEELVEKAHKKDLRKRGLS